MSWWCKIWEWLRPSKERELVDALAQDVAKEIDCEIAKEARGFRIHLEGGEFKVDDLNFEQTEPFSASFWFKSPSEKPQTRRERIVGYIERWRFRLRQRINRLLRRPDKRFDDGKWHHVVCTRGGMEEPKIYVDGVEQGEERPKGGIEYWEG